MIVAILLAMTLALASAVPAHRNGSCRLGDWSDWGACTSSKVCRHEEHSSHPEPPTTWDKTRLRMKWMMEEKNRARASHKEQTMKRAEAFQCVDGVADGYPCWNIDQLSFLSIADLGYIVNAPGESTKELNDVWGWTDAGDGNNEYAIVGLTGGTSFVRVTDPFNPEVLCFMYTETRAATWRDMKVVNDHAYIVADVADHGMQVFDLHRLRSMTAAGFHNCQPDVHYAEFGNAHNIAENKNGQYVVAVGATNGQYPRNCRGGLHIVDVSNPKAPTFAGCFASDGYVHDTQCVTYNGPDTRYTGREICFCYNEDSFTIVDITNPANGVLVSREVYNGFSYTHQGWCSEDFTIAYLDDELDEMDAIVGNKNTRTYIWDIRDLQNPALMRTFLSGEQSIDHNMYVLNGYVYQSNYRAGLRMLKEMPNYNLQEVGYFDVFPSGTTATFGGTWSNYPYFNSGAIALTSMEFGLFMVRPDWNLIPLVTSGEVHTHQERTREVINNYAGVNCGHVTESRTCAAEAKITC